jgi:acetylornithine deacetylase
MQLRSFIYAAAALIVSAHGFYVGYQQPLRASSLGPPTDFLALHKSLVEISSITGNEHKVADWLTSYLQQNSFTVEKQKVRTETGEKTYSRYNILAYTGKSRKSRTLVTSHIDTVPPYWPYERRFNNEIWGRGTVDAKGSVASQLIAVQELLASKEIQNGDVALLYVVGEETGGLGMRAANDLGLSWETVIFGEPTELKLAAGHKGIMGVKITAKGKAGHSGYPELGRNANSMLVRLLSKLESLELPSSEKYGNTTVNIGILEGGVAPNVIAESASATLALRVAAGEPKDIEDMIREAANDIGDFFDLEFSHGYGPVDIDHDVEGFETIVVNYGTDIPNLQGEHKRYLYGPGDILVAHSDHEHLKVADLEEAVEGYKQLIEASLK